LQAIKKEKDQTTKTTQGQEIQKIRGPEEKKARNQRPDAHKEDEVRDSKS
jgi:hypothetical protein